MPIPTRAFACSFKCGQRVVVSRKSMERHEAQCIHNPETRSCPTCVHNDFEYPEPEVGICGGHFCNEDHLEKGETLKRNCPHWKQEESNK